VSGSFSKHLIKANPSFLDQSEDFRRNLLLFPKVWAKKCTANENPTNQLSKENETLNEDVVTILLLLMVQKSGKKQPHWDV